MTVRNMEKEYLIDLEDVIIHTEADKFQVQHAMSFAAFGAANAPVVGSWAPSRIVAAQSACWHVRWRTGGRWFWRFIRIAGRLGINDDLSGALARRFRRARPPFCFIGSSTHQIKFFRPSSYSSRESSRRPCRHSRHMLSKLSLMRLHRSHRGRPRSKDRTGLNETIRPDQGAIAPRPDRIAQ
jgi:hypothetical protein